MQLARAAPPAIAANSPDAAFAIDDHLIANVSRHEVWRGLLQREAEKTISVRLALTNDLHSGIVNCQTAAGNGSAVDFGNPEEAGVGVRFGENGVIGEEDGKAVVENTRAHRQLIDAWRDFCRQQ